MGKSTLVFQFQLEGEFAGFTGESRGQFKYLRLSAAEQELHVKLAKNLRSVVVQELIPGDRIFISGEKKVKKKTGALELKADRVERLSCSLDSLSSLEQCISERRPCLPKGKILFCKKSGCLKRGGKQLYRNIEETLAQLGLQEQVTIEQTGCQKRCKKAPNFILMPGKVKSGFLSPQDIRSLIEEHYCD
ncbi:MAG: (2Fe-2S) ferredoxin domain-containing protein [Cyanobacteriota bacterium]|nr:(2Fe-2S) ferredoxin domain-containing protein [Cyanobacteriota bacterium]